MNETFPNGIDVKDLPKNDRLKSYNGKWANFAITKTGTFQGSLEFDNEEQARKQGDIWLKTTKVISAEHNSDVKCQMGTGRFLFFLSDFQTMIQLPIGKK